MTSTFKVGDKVTALGQHLVTITYGPFLSTFDRHEMYVVRDGAGRERSYHTTDLTARPAFSIGDTVSYEYGEGGKLVAGPFKTEYHDESIWVVEKADGNHMIPTQNALSKVEPVDDEPVKVGNRVRILRATYASASHGKTGVVTSNTETWRVGSNDLHRYEVRMDDGDTLRVAELEKVTSTPEPSPFTYAGETYTPGVAYVDQGGDSWTFELCDGKAVSDRSSWARDKTLEHVVRNYGPLEAN